MAGPPSNPSTVSNLLSTHRALLDTLTSFFTVCTHHILYLRRVYPPVSFLSTRAFNYPVRQNRHPAVCTWIIDAIAAVRNQLEKNTVERVALYIYECDGNRILERWTFDLHSLPAVAKRDRDVPFESEPGPSDDGDVLVRKVNLADLEANFRATLSRISTAASKLRPLPEGPDGPECSFTLAIEVKDNADRPVGRLEKQERAWIAAEPDSFASAGSNQTEELPGSSAEGAQSTSQTHAVRRLDTGELRMEVWVEESAHKFGIPLSASQSQRTASERAKSMSYGAGTETFDPDVGYDLEPADIGRKPQGGAMTDYQRG